MTGTHQRAVLQCTVEQTVPICEKIHSPFKAFKNVFVRRLQVTITAPQFRTLNCGL